MIFELLHLVGIGMLYAIVIVCIFSMVVLPILGIYHTIQKRDPYWMTMGIILSVVCIIISFGIELFFGHLM